LLNFFTASIEILLRPSKTGFVVISYSINFQRSSWDFPFDFLPTKSVGLFRDFLPAPQICKSIFQSRHMHLNLEGLCCRRRAKAVRVSPRKLAFPAVRQPIAHFGPAFLTALPDPGCLPKPAASCLPQKEFGGGSQEFQPRQQSRRAPQIKMQNKMLARLRPAAYARV
jgi:hypothetical protein